MKGTSFHWIILTEICRLYGGFVLACWDFRGRFVGSLPAGAFSLLFFKWRSARTHQFHFFFRPGSVHSGSANWDDCGQVFPDELRVSSVSLIGSHTRSGQHSQSRLGHFWQNDRSLLRATVVTGGGVGVGVEWTLNKSPHRKLTREKTILPPLLPGLELTTFRSRPGAVQTSYPGCSCHVVM